MRPIKLTARCFCNRRLWPRGGGRTEAAASCPELAGALLSSSFSHPFPPSPIPPQPLSFLDHVVQLWGHCVGLKLGSVWGCGSFQPPQHLGVVGALPWTLTMVFKANANDSHGWNVGGWSHKGRRHKGRIFIDYWDYESHLSAGTLCGALCNGMVLGANWSPALAPWSSQSLWMRFLPFT